MKFIVDANILFAALIKEGKTAELLLNPSFTLYAPDFLCQERLKQRLIKNFSILDCHQRQKSLRFKPCVLEHLKHECLSQTTA